MKIDFEKRVVHGVEQKSRMVATFACNGEVLETDWYPIKYAPRSADVVLNVLSSGLCYLSPFGGGLDPSEAREALEYLLGRAEGNRPRPRNEADELRKEVARLKKCLDAIRCTCQGRAVRMADAALSHTGE
jgi:hypothetical protein